MKARRKTYTKRNIQRAFEATGIWPMNERRILDHTRSETRKPMRTPASRSHRVIPVTPGHGRAILIHGRYTMNVLPRQTPRSIYAYGMVEKLYKAAAKATAQNVILTIENANLRQKATSAADRAKARSRKELSKARVMDADDVLRIREEQEEKEWLAAERQARVALKKGKAPALKPSRTTPKTALAGSSRNLRTPNKQRPAAKKVVIDDSPITVDSDDGEWNGIDSEWEDGELPGGDDGVEDTIIVEPELRALRRSARGHG